MAVSSTLPQWARWNGAPEEQYTLGVEEELMLLEPGNGSLAQSSDEVIGRLSEGLAPHVSPETHAAVVELKTGSHAHVDGVASELTAIRRRLAREVGAMGLDVAASGTHPLIGREPTQVSGAPRYRRLAESLRSLARREPTMALHVHVGVSQPEDATRLLNALRYSVPVLIALAANSPFWQGLDGGFDSARTVIFQAFPRTGLPRAFADYADYVDSVDSLIGPGVVPDPSFLWWDVRLQPGLGTVEVRAMDAQSTVADVVALVALIQSLAHLELESPAPMPAIAAEALAENRFLAARDGMDARLIDPVTGRLTPVRQMVAALITKCHPHAQALGCAGMLERVRSLAASNGASDQRAIAAAGGGVGDLVPRLTAKFATHGLEREHDRKERPCVAGSLTPVPRFS